MLVGHTHQSKYYKIFLGLVLLLFSNQLIYSQDLLQRFDAEETSGLCDVSTTGLRLALHSFSRPLEIDIYTRVDFSWEFSSSIVFQEQILDIEFLSDELLVVSENDESTSSVSIGKTRVYQFKDANWVNVNTLEHYFCTDFDCTPGVSYNEISGNLAIVNNLDSGPLFGRSRIEIFNVSNLEVPNYIIDLDEYDYTFGYNIDFNMSGDSIFVLGLGRDRINVQDVLLVKSIFSYDGNEWSTSSIPLDSPSQFELLANARSHFTRTHGGYISAQHEFGSVMAHFSFINCDGVVRESISMLDRDNFVDIDVQSDRFVFIEDLDSNLDTTAIVHFGMVSNNGIELLHDFFLTVSAFTNAKLSEDGDLLLVTNNLNGFDLFDMSSVGVDNVVTPLIELDFFPNPAVDHIHFVMPENIEGGLLTIFDSLGRKTMSYTFVGNDNSLDVSSLETGVYIADFKLDNNTGFTRSFIKIDN